MSDLEQKVSTTHQLNATSDSTKDYELKEAKKSKQRCVGSYLWIRRLRNVDMVNEIFEAEIHLFVNWATTEQEYLHFNESKGKTFFDPKYEPLWTPKFIFANAELTKNDLKGYRVFKKGDLDYYGYPVDHPRIPYFVEALYEIEGKFTSPFALKNFPLDCQDLLVTLEMSDPLEEAIFTPKLSMTLNDGHTQADLTTKYSNVNEYIMHKFMVEFLETDYGNDWNNYSILNFRIKLQRKWQTYFWKLGIYLFVTSFSSVVAFGMDDVASQYGLLITLLLTIVAFQFVAASFLPRISYLTLMDYYIIFCFSFLFAIFIAVTILDFMNVDEDTEILCYIISAAFYVVVHIFSIIPIYKRRQYELKKLELDYFDLCKQGYTADNQSGGELNVFKNDVSLSKKMKEFYTNTKLFEDLNELNGK